MLPGSRTGARWNHGSTSCQGTRRNGPNFWASFSGTPVSPGWDRTNQGFYVALGDDQQPLSSDTADAPRQAFGALKSYWSPPEAIGAAAVLESLTGEPRYAADRQLLWQYCRTHMIDEDRGGWFKVPATGRKADDAPKGDMYDPDYHALGGCFETLRSLGQ
jgi:mannose/cellobiose epimerase-like protein (N-acyl-D-glucosamine 2-epimerase family)